MIITKLYLNETGLAIFLGGKTQELVYRAVLAECGSIRSIRAFVNAQVDAPLAYTTIATIANKLCRKGVLARENVNQWKPEYRYTVLISQQELIKCGIHLVITKLLTEFPNALRSFSTKEQ